MKYIYLLFCMALSLILLSGCGSSSNSSKGTDWEPTINETVNNLNGVTMLVKQGTVSSSGLTVIFENNSDKQCIYGEYYMLEKEIESRWYQVPVIVDGNHGFPDIGYDLVPSDVKEWTVDWGGFYGNLDSGKYRIVKDILDFRKPGDYDKYYVTAEFTID
ncbi:hypothetical protein J27TS8_24690 [Robertmurraya siralis]|uniref:Bacterial Ig-like domain-containing protein n=2 Tax=Robertmurraya siralis TaxID=77777 RepID=A0A919WIS3_9BACI|nr:hypothetical protein J27TS8_24690 [Robertmurraya siralis]